MTGLDPGLVPYVPDDEPYRIACADEPPAWLDELELRPAPPHHRMGTRALDLDQWFLVDRHRDAELALRHRLLVERNAEVFAALPSASRASEEAAELIASWAAARGLVGLDAPPPAHPLAAAGLLVQEDLCLMVRRDGAWRLDGAVLCFPSMWVLAEKLGHTVGDVHRPVDHYDTDLEPRVDVFFDRLRVDRPVWRRNFSLKTTPALFLPTSKQAAQAAPPSVGPDGSPYWLRSERQTLRKLPRTGAILFGIRVQLAPVRVLRQRPDRAADLLATIDSWDAAMRDFKSAETMDGLRAWLAAVVASADVSSTGAGGGAGAPAGP